MDFGPLSHYNGIIFDSHTAMQADTEGALAVWGDARFGSPGQTYDIGAAGSGIYMGEYQFIGDYENPEGYPTLVLGGLLNQESNNCRFYKGNMVMKLSNKDNYEANTVKLEVPSGYSIQYLEDKLVDSFFTEAYQTINGLGKALSGLSSVSLATNAFKNMHQLPDLAKYEVILADGTKSLVFNIEDQGDNEVSLSEVNLPSTVDDYDLIIINSDATVINMTQGAVLYNGSIVDTSAPKVYDANKIMRHLIDKMIWNFPNAKEVNIVSYGIVGALLAPEADVVTNGGSCNGMFAAHSLYQAGGFELHGFKIANYETIWNLIEEIEPVYGDVQILKVDKEDNDLTLKQAGFDLYYLSEGEWTLDTTKLTTDENGRLSIDNLQLGEYKLVETKAPAGYKLPEDADTFFTIKTNEENQIIELGTITITNEAVKGRLDLLKVDEDEPTEGLQGAVFTLYIKGEEGWDELASGLTTNENGRLSVTDLNLGDYMLVETNPPYGYSLPEDNTTCFSIEEGENGEAADLEELVITNSALRSRIEFVKIDAEDETQTLSGAKFTLYMKTDGEWKIYLSDLVTDKNGHLVIENLMPGEYKLIEVLPPDQYQIGDGQGEHEFSIALNELGRALELEVIPLANDRLKGVVEVLKVDADDRDTVLEDAEFSLYYKVNEAWRLYGSGYKTEANGVLIISGLDMGDYKLVETKAPYGYELPANPECEFTLTTDENRELVEIEVLVIANEKISGGVEFIKVDADDRDHTLENAVFSLYLKIDGEWVEQQSGLVTDRNGRLIIKDLLPGEYKLSETKAPSGYELPEDNDTLFTVEIGENGEMIEISPITITNTKLTGSVRIIKVDEDDAQLYLPGAEFTLYRKVDNQWEAYAVNLITGADGMLEIKQLSTGDYKLLETKSPEGYEEERKK